MTITTSNVGLVMDRFNTASGRYYCNKMDAVLCNETAVKNVSIPQAVGTIAIIKDFIRHPLFKDFVSIPQAVGTIAI